MTALAPLETLLDASEGTTLPLTDILTSLYGGLRFPLKPDRQYVIANFVSTIDGVVSLGDPAYTGGSEISGQSKHDRLVMGILRAVADVVIVGAGTLRDVPGHLWTAEHIYAAFSTEFQNVRKILGKPPAPLNVIVTSSGEVATSLPVFKSGKVPARIITTLAGKKVLDQRALSGHVGISVIGEEGPISARAILDDVSDIAPGGIILVEGGPVLVGCFLEEKCLDELFLTFAPQIAGRSSEVKRPGLVSGKIFSPDKPLWASLVSLKRFESHLFLRYSFSGK